MAISHAWPRAFHAFLTPFVNRLEHPQQRQWA